MPETYTKDIENISSGDCLIRLTKINSFYSATNCLFIFLSPFSPRVSHFVVCKKKCKTGVEEDALNFEWKDWAS